MWIDDALIRPEEKLIFTLRELYSRNGYCSYRMNKFEPYDFYVHNKDFLVSGEVITFTDIDGRLKALRPDVTLSIVNNSRYAPGEVRRLYYDEKVYRKKSGEFREIPQMGLEALGDITEETITEVVGMALSSLDAIGGESALRVSHPGLLSRVLDRLGLTETGKEKILAAVSCKANHEVSAVLSAEGIGENGEAVIRQLTELPADPEKAVRAIAPVLSGAEETACLRELEALLNVPAGEKLRLDFSVPGNMHYYSGPVFNGYVKGVPAPVLSGGRYDLLLRRLGKQGGAIGFAVYLDLIKNA